MALDCPHLAPWTLDDLARRKLAHGHRVHQHDGVWWRGLADQPFCEPLDPFLRLPRSGPRPAAVESLLGHRFLTTEPGDANAHYNPMVMEDLSQYRIERLDSRRRACVRRGLRRVTVRPVALDELLRDGWQIEDEAYQRNGFHRPPPRAQWERRVRDDYREPVEHHTLGAFVDERLVAFLTWYGVDGDLHLPIIVSGNEGNRRNAIDAMQFELLTAARESGRYRRAINTVHTRRASLDAFKESHLFRLRALPARLTFRPLVAPLLRRFRPQLFARIVGIDEAAAQRWRASLQAAAHG